MAAASGAAAMLGVIAKLPNEAPRFVPVGVDLLSTQLNKVACVVRRSLRTVLGVDEDEDSDEDDFRLLYQERDLDEESSAAAFLKSLSTGTPCIVRVLFRLLGGKGGFGALLRKQSKKGKKTTNFDASRDLTGRRIRHSKAVERIKEWMEKNKREDDLVKLIVGEGPDLPKAPDPNDSLDPEYVRKLKRAAADRPAVVSEGLRKLLEEEEEARADAQTLTVGSSGSNALPQELTKRPRVEHAGVGGAASVDWLHAMGALGALGTLSSPENDDGSASDEGKDVGTKSTGGEASGAASLRTNGSQPSASASSAVNSAASSAAAAALETVEEEEDEENEEEDGVAVAAEKPDATGAVAPSPVTSDAVGAAEAAPSKRRGGRGAAPAIDASPNGPTLGPEELERFKSPEELAVKVTPEDLKRSLMHWGMKCGGTPKERAERLFLLRDQPLKDLPKSVFAPKK